MSKSGLFDRRSKSLVPGSLTLVTIPFEFGKFLRTFKLGTKKPLTSSTILLDLKLGVSLWNSVSIRGSDFKQEYLK